MEVLSHELTLTLNEVFKDLASGKLPRDDTLLEKVLTWLQEILYCSASCEKFLDLTGFNDCLSRVCFLEEIDFRVWSFLLRLSGHVASQLQETRIAADFLDTVRTLFNKTIKQDHLWCQAAIRCSWLNGLELWLSDHQFFSKAVVSMILQSLEDSSWFVSKASVSLISRILHNTVTPGGDKESLSTTLLTHVLSCLDKTNLTLALNRQRFIACMRVLEIVCSEAICYSFLCDIVPHDALVSQLCFAIESSADEQLNERCTAVLQVMSALWHLNVHRDKLYEKLSDLSQKLLLSSHLSMAVETAAWTLERWSGETSKSIMLENICLLPLWISVRSEAIENDDLPLLSPCPVDHDCYKNIVSMMNHSTAKHLSLVKMSLTVITQLHSQIIQRELVFGLVKDVLEQTTNDCQKQKLLQANNRLKHQCLHVLHTVLTFLSEADVNVLLDVCPVTVNLLLQPDHDQVTISKAYELLLDLLKVFGDRNSPQVDVLLAELPAILQRTVNSLNWDIRDTAMNFIRKLMSLCTDSTAISIWVEQNNIIQYISGSLKDSESYVRASALNALGNMCHSVLFQSEKIKSEVQTHLWPEVVKLCQTDAETFSRRAAIELVISFHASRLMSFEERTFENVMLHAVSDPDWDVKMKAVTFWHAYAEDLFINRYSSGETVLNVSGETVLNVSGETVLNISGETVLNVSSDLSYLMKILTESGCLNALITAAGDCDKSVQLLGLKALKNVKEHSANCLKLTLHCDKTDNSANLERPSFNCLNEERESADDPLRDILNYFKFCQAQASTAKDKRQNGISLLRYLASLDLDSLITNAERSTDGHDGRPESLLNDLLMSLMMPVTCGSGFTSSEEEDGDDEMAVDCY